MNTGLFLLLLDQEGYPPFPMTFPSYFTQKV